MKINIQNISEEKLSVILQEAKFYSLLTNNDLKMLFKFRYKRITKHLYPEYFIS